MIQTQPLEVKDFSYGITDYFIDGLPYYAKTMRNFFLTPDNKALTVWGSRCFLDQLPLGTLRVNKLAKVSGNILGFQDKRAYRKNGSTWAQILGPASGTFLTAGDSNSVIINAEWQDHTFFTSDAFGSPQKVYLDGTSTYRVRNAGLPDLPAGFSVTNPSGAGSSYLYAAMYSYDYQVATVSYTDLGPVFFYSSAVTGGAINAGNTTTVTIPTTLTPAENWDTTNLKIQIYRTADGGTSYFKVGQVSYGTSSFIDNIQDTALVSNLSLYTNGGIASNNTPPKAKYVHVVNGYGYWAHYKEGTEVLSTEIRQSKQDDPDSVPSNFIAVTEQPIRGLSSIFDRPIVLCDKYIYRIDNYIADDGTGGMLLRRLDDQAGCVSAPSITQTHVGLFWAGENNFYWSDGFRVVSISDHLNKTYKKWILNQARKDRITGTFDSSNQRLFWSVCKEDGSNEPDMVLVVDLKKPFLPQGNKQGASFSEMGGNDTNFRATQLLFVGDSLYRGDTRGYVLEHNEDYFTDLKIDTGAAPSTWQETTVKWLYESCFLDFGSKFVRKWVPRILISADNTTNLSLAIGSSNDNNRVTGTLKPIRYRANITWGDSLPIWGDPLALWNRQGLIEEWRRFPAGGLRCNYKQIILQNDLSKIFDSDLLGTVTVNASGKTATLGGSFQWSDDLIGYFISFEHDNYTQDFEITSSSSTTIVYDDPTSAGPITNGLYKWIIRGYPKGEVFQLNGYVIHWAYLSKSHTPYSASSSGGTP